MKKILTVLLCICLMLSVSACGENIPKLIEDGKLHVGIDPYYEPMEMKDGETYSGIDVEIILAVAEKMGLEVVFEDLAWSAIFIALDGGQVDIICSSVSITQARIDEKKMIFSEPYFSNGIYIVVPKGKDTIKTLEDLEGLTISVQEDTTADIACKKQAEKTDGPKFTISSYETVQMALLALESGQVDALVCDAPVAMGFVQKNPDKFEISSVKLSNEPIAIALRAGNEELQKEINEALKALHEDGTLSKISIKYLGEDYTKDIDPKLF